MKPKPKVALIPPSYQRRGTGHVEESRGRRGGRWSSSATSLKDKRAEERLREYERALEAVEEMVAVVNREYRYLFANRSFLKFRGLKKEEIIGRLVAEVRNRESCELVVKERLDEAFSGKIITCETKYTCREAGQR